MAYAIPYKYNLIVRFCSLTILYVTWLFAWYYSPNSYHKGEK